VELVEPCAERWEESVRQPFGREAGLRQRSQGVLPVPAAVVEPSERLVQLVTQCSEPLVLVPVQPGHTLGERTERCPRLPLLGLRGLAPQYQLEEPDPGCGLVRPVPLRPEPAELFLLGVERFLFLDRFAVLLPRR